MLAIQYAMMAMYYAALTIQCAIVTVDDAAWDRMTRRWTVYDAPAVADAVEARRILGHTICDAGPYNMRCRTMYYAPKSLSQPAKSILKPYGDRKRSSVSFIYREAGRARERARPDDPSTSDR